MLKVMPDQTIIGWYHVAISCMYMTRAHNETSSIVLLPVSSHAKYTGTQKPVHICLAQLTDGFPNSASAEAIKWSAGA